MDPADVFGIAFCLAVIIGLWIWVVIDSRKYR